MKIWCVKEARRRPVKTTPTTGPAAPPLVAAPAGPLTSKVSLHAHLDPNWRQYGADPHLVNYPFSASATLQNFTTDSIQVGGEEPAPLPPGTLTLSSDGTQECSVEVGGPIRGSECVVDYGFELGRHEVTVTYIGDDGQSVTEGVEVDLKPLPTTSSLVVNYNPYAEPRPIEPGVWQIGMIDFGLWSVPAGVPQLRVGCEPPGGGFEVHPDGCISLEFPIPLAVYGTAIGACAEPEVDEISIGYPDWSEPQFRGPLMPIAGIEDGAYYVRASIQEFGGYLGSETTVPLKFSPEVALPPDC